MESSNEAIIVRSSSRVDMLTNCGLHSAQDGSLFLVLLQHFHCFFLFITTSTLGFYTWVVMVISNRLPYEVLYESQDSLNKCPIHYLHQGQLQQQARALPEESHKVRSIQKVTELLVNQSIFLAFQLPLNTTIFSFYLIYWAYNFSSIRGREVSSIWSDLVYMSTYDPTYDPIWSLLIRVAASDIFQEFQNRFTILVNYISEQVNFCLPNQGLTMLPKLISNSWVQVILLPQQSS
jgi:hypothetical protein